MSPASYKAFRQAVIVHEFARKLGLWPLSDTARAARAGLEAIRRRPTYIGESPSERAGRLAA